MNAANRLAEPSPPFAGRGYRLMQLGFWSLFALTVAVTLLSGPPEVAFDDMKPDMENAFKKAFTSLQPVMWIHNGVMIVCGLVATHVLHWLTLRRRWDRLPVRQLVFIMLPTCIVLAVLISLFINAFRASAVAPQFGVRVLSHGLFMEILSTSIVSLFLLGMWSALYYACHAFTRLHHLEVTNLRVDSAIKESRLQTIATQLNPHFLFNSLNTVRALIEESPKQARDAVTQLSRVLRASLSSSDQKFILLSDELTTVNALLDLEIARYGDRLRVEREVEPSCEKTWVPPLLLVTLVENAVKHGVAAKLGPGFLHYRIRRESSKLCLRVMNSGTLNEDWQNKGGIGLAHTQERLSLLFGDEASLTIQSVPEGVIVSVTFPHKS